MRIERDAMGEVRIPEDALWGAQTQRAVENFPISGETLDPGLIQALGMIKAAAARANLALGRLEDRKARAIISAADQVSTGAWDDQFPVDVFQTGSGTSTNMNVNEVVANLANLELGEKLGSRHPIHPNDHVNMSQSSNDVIPSAIQMAVVRALREELIPALNQLSQEFTALAERNQGVIKSGRTHLQDALPVRMDQVFAGYAAQIEKNQPRFERVIASLLALPLGGTAVGTGAARPPAFPEVAIEHLRDQTGLKFQVRENHMEGNASRDDLVDTSGVVKTAAVSITKVANDLRWMASGPRAGLQEINLPRVQPGSSIMPGKDNPVIIEAVIMTAAQVIGNDAAVTQGGLGGIFEINLMMPLIAYNVLNSVHWMAAAVSVFQDRCVRGIEVNRDRCQELVEGNLALATGLVSEIGYDRAAELSAEARRTGQTILEVARSRAVLPDEELNRLLDPARLTGPDQDEAS